MTRPSLSDSLRASLSKGGHVDTAEKIAFGLPHISDGTHVTTIAEILPVKAVEQLVADSVSTQDSDKSTKQLANVPDIKPANEPDNESVSKPVQANYPDNQPVTHMAYEPVDYPANKSDSHPVHRPAIYPDNHQAHKPDCKVSKSSDPEIWNPYTEKQGRVLLYLIVAGGRAKREIIANDTGVNIATVKYALRIFVKDGFISPTNLDVNHTMRGFRYALNPHLCNEYAARILGSGHTPIKNQTTYPANELTRYPDNRSVFNPANKPTNHPVNSPVPPFSSKVFLEENLTTSKPGLLNEPELLFWAGEGVTEKQVANWVSEFQLSKDEIVLSLRYGRFDILERGDVQNSANWFYKIMTRNGFYPRPANYRSLLEIRAEALHQQQERDREAKAKLEDVEFESRFQAFLADTDAPLYQELLNQVNSFAIEQLKDGDRKFIDIELRELFKNKIALNNRNY